MFNPDQAIEDAWVRSGGRCEKKHALRGRHVRCEAVLSWELRRRTHAGGWQAYSTGDPTLGGWEAVNQCQILCGRCYAETTREKQAGHPLDAPYTHRIAA
jgi:hypothetical protein